MASFRATPPEFYPGRDLAMADLQKIKWVERPAVSVALRYGLAVVSVAAALGSAQVFLYFHLPQPFTAFALSAIAITYSYGGTLPDGLAALLCFVVSSFFFHTDMLTV